MHMYMSHVHSLPQLHVYCVASMLFGHSSPFSGFTLLQLTESRGVCEK